MAKYRILDLFCGAGGFSYGMDKNPNFETLIALDNDKYAGETFKKNMPYVDVIIGDITDETTKTSIIEKAKKLDINMVIGGPPCQGYSMKGKKLGLKDPRNFLFREYLSFVEKYRGEDSNKKKRDLIERFELDTSVKIRKMSNFVIVSFNASDYKEKI